VKKKKKVIQNSSHLQHFLNLKKKAGKLNLFPPSKQGDSLCVFVWCTSDNPITKQVKTLLFHVPVIFPKPQGVFVSPTGQHISFAG